MRYFKIIVASVILIGAMAAQAQTPYAYTSWEPGYQDKGVEIDYRWVSWQKKNKSREIRCRFYVDARPDEIIGLFQNQVDIQAWAVGAKACEVKPYDQEQWWVYTLFDVPWPLEPKDIVTHYRKEEKGGIVTLYMVATPDRFPRRSDVSRMERYQGSWTFTPQEGGKTKVEFCSLTFKDPPVPRFILDPIIQRMMVNSLTDFTKLAEAKK
ncbi:MAG: hypothetical protein AAFP83_23170 [Bacteroidota bacterium]